jgi:hypothetical protein
LAAGKQIYNLRTRVEPGKAGKVIRGQAFDLGRWSMGGIEHRHDLAEDHTTIWSPHFVLRVLRELVIGAHENPEFP